MLKKKCVRFFVVLGTFLIFCFSASAEQKKSDFSYVNELENSVVMYQCPDNWQFFILKNEGLYNVRLFNSSTKKNYQGIFEINKGEKTNIKLHSIVNGEQKDVLENILPKLEELYSFSDDKNREKLPEDVSVSKNGKIAKLAFFVPFTNVLNVKDKNGKELYSCKKIGRMKNDELQYFSQMSLWPNPRILKMKEVSYDKTKTFKASDNNFEMILPSIWKSENDYYFLPDSSPMDSIIFKDSEKWKNYKTKDFYEVIALDILEQKAAFIIPETVKIYKKGDLFCSEYILGDVASWESNRRIKGYYSTSSENFEYICFSGFSDFIDKNRTMIDQIIDSVKIKK